MARVTKKQQAALALIEESGTMTVSGLAEAMDMPPASAGVVAGGLVAHGLVARDATGVLKVLPREGSGPPPDLEAACATLLGEVRSRLATHSYPPGTDPKVAYAARAALDTVIAAIMREHEERS